MNKTRSAAAFTAAIVLAVSLSGCGNKATQPFQDAPRDGINNAAAEVVTMPDGFSNMATKCDHGNRVYSAYHGNSGYAAITVIPGDPTCK